jgi:hypothetical protein
VQSVRITTKVVSSNPGHGEVYLIQHYVIKFVSYLRHVAQKLFTDDKVKVSYRGGGVLIRGV